MLSHVADDVGEHLFVRHLVRAVAGIGGDFGLNDGLAGGALCGLKAAGNDRRWKRTSGSGT